MKRFNTAGALINSMIGCVSGFALVLSGCAAPTSSGARSSGEAQGFINSATNGSAFATVPVAETQTPNPSMPPGE